MKTVKAIIFTVGIVLAGSCYAQGMQNDSAPSQYRFNNNVEQPYFPIESFQHPKTRAQVMQELQFARAAGQLWQGESDNRLPAAGPTSGVSRAQVLKELAEARAAGRLTEGELNYTGAS